MKRSGRLPPPNDAPLRAHRGRPLLRAPDPVLTSKNGAQGRIDPTRGTP
jgi:hypothetical protein